MFTVIFLKIGLQLPWFGELCDTLLSFHRDIAFALAEKWRGRRVVRGYGIVPLQRWWICISRGQTLDLRWKVSKVKVESWEKFGTASGINQLIHIHFSCSERWPLTSNICILQGTRSTVSWRRQGRHEGATELMVARKQGYCTHESRPILKRVSAMVVNFCLASRTSVSVGM